MERLWGAVCLFVLFAASVAAQDTNHQQQSCSVKVGAPVKTTSGTVIGHNAPNATTVSEYIGIPFAHPPLGDLRFAPPVAYKSNRNITAARFGHDCPALHSGSVPTFLPPTVRNFLGDQGMIYDTPSEDCLFINVWSKPQSGSLKKPVLVWVYGGGFTSGGTNTSSYSGQYFADSEDVVFVSFNYRLSIFGFPGAPGLTQNAGLLDQRLAVEWVRDNVAAFGGDPERITIFGQSAGGASVDYYNYAWVDDPIIAGSIMQSGTAVSFGNRLPESASKAWFTTAGKAGCGNSSAEAERVLSCMRQQSMEKLLHAEAPGSGLASILGNFGPTIDDKTVFSNYTELALSQKFIHAPSLIGNDGYEAGLFKLVLAESPDVKVTADEWDGFNRGTFICPAGTAAEFRHYAGVPVWRYMYNAVFPNTRLPTSSYGQAWHGSELLPLFGTSEVVTKSDSTWQERALGGYMRGAWAQFAHCPKCGLSDSYGWPEYSIETASVIQLGYEDTLSNDFSGLPSLNTSQMVDIGCGSFPYGGSANH